MPSPALETFAAEVAKQQADIKPIIEGLEDYSRLNISPDTKTIVQASLTEAKKRQTLLDAAMKAVTDLQVNNYPELPVKIVKAAVYADLEAQKKTIDAALGKFTPEAEASVANIVAGAPQPK